MMLNNMVSLQKEVEKLGNVEAEAYLKAKLGFNLMNIFKLGDAETGGNIKGAGSKKVLETFEIKTTKSVILNEVIRNTKLIETFSDINEGELVKIDNVKLSLENEDELRIVKFINSGALKDLVAPGTAGFDINGIFNSMFKDYAYKIKGEFSSGSENILIKIPLTFENEFESSYSVDDLFVGKVSVVGLYKGIIKVDDLKNSFQYFQELGQFQQFMQVARNNEDEEIQESHYVENKRREFAINFKSSGGNEDYHYIDLLAIIQNVSIQKGE